MSSSHLFVTHADLHQLACDAWLLSTDVHGTVTDGWLASADAPTREWMRSLSRGLSSMCEVMPATGLAHPSSPGDARTAPPRPLVVATDVGRHHGASTADFLPAVATFVATAAAAARTRPLIAKRERPLLAIPAIGTGEGGASDTAGALLRELFPALRTMATEHGVDVAFVARTRSMHAAAQRARLALSDAFSSLSPELLDHARALAGHARAGRLVLFLGAGVSAGAGLPDWSSLLRQLADAGGVPWEDGLATLGALEQGEVLARTLDANGSSVGAHVATLLDGHQRHSLGHALLAALPVREVITQNYDRLFERASRAVLYPHRLAVLPFEPDAAASRWLLKMHGTVEHPGSIVLSRTDYLRYAEERGALMGIVQAMLLTKHMLFVGFSLNDPNFHRIADSVRRATEAAPHPAAGEERSTVLTLRKHDLARSIWPEVRWVETSDPANAGDTAAAARRLDVLLDAVGAHAVGPAPLLEDRFAALHDDHDREALAPLLHLAELHARRKASSPLWDAVGRLLDELGHEAVRDHGDAP